jgi:hypothetical protein
MNSSSSIVEDGEMQETQSEGELDFGVLSEAIVESYTQSRRKIHD